MTDLLNLPKEVAKLSNQVEELKTIVSTDKKPQQSKVLTPVEVMKILKISRSTFDRWIRDGHLKSAKVGGAIRVKEEHVYELFK